MQYVFHINIQTDRDFNFSFVPNGMRQFQDGSYSLEKTYIDKEKAVKDALNICAFLKDHICTKRDYVKEEWHQCVDEFMDRLCTNSDHEYVGAFMGGNYAETEISFRSVKGRCSFDFSVTDEELELINKNENDVTLGMIKKAVLALYK